LNEWWRFTGKSTIGISTTEFRQYCRYEKLSRLSQEYDNTNFHVVSYWPESPTPLHPHLHPHTTPRQVFKFGNIVEIPLSKFLLLIFRLTILSNISIQLYNNLEQYSSIFTALLVSFIFLLKYSKVYKYSD
jgi:hypothetical protein